MAWTVDKFTAMVKISFNLKSQAAGRSREVSNLVKSKIKPSITSGMNFYCILLFSAIF